MTINPEARAQHERRNQDFDTGRASRDAEVGRLEARVDELEGMMKNQAWTAGYTFERLGDIEVWTPPKGDEMSDDYDKRLERESRRMGLVLLLVFLVWVAVGIGAEWYWGTR